MKSDLILLWVRLWLLIIQILHISRRVAFLTVCFIKAAFWSIYDGTAHTSLCFSSCRRTRSCFTSWLFYPWRASLELDSPFVSVHHCPNHSFSFCQFREIWEGTLLLPCRSLTTVATSSYLAGLSISIVIYRVFFHWLRNFPGPSTAKLTKLSHVSRLVKQSDNHFQADRLHKEYGEIVRRIGHWSPLWIVP